MNVQIQRAISVAKRITFGGAAAALLLFMPTPYVLADSADTSTPPASTQCSPVAPAPTGITRPTGADATTYTYNSCTGLWENAYYTWSPATQTATPKTPYVYTCNTTSWQWTTLKWVYVPASSSYVQTTITVAQLPAGAVVAAGSPVPCAPPSTATIANAGANSNSTINSDNTTNTTVNNTDNNLINNQLNSIALTGNASVLNNNTGGNAATGNAIVTADVLNAIQSPSGLGNVITFVANINGDVQGNLVVDPSKLQPASGTETLNNTNNLTVNNTNSNQITNNLNLNATTGSATVSGNGTGGNATSGNAEAVANVINMLNSVITSGKSFVGVININGNLNGNILLPQSFMDSLIASNAPSTTVNLSQTQANNLGITTTNNQAITNNVTSSATTGSATVSGNGTGGTATTGNAAAQVQIFNLTGNHVVSANSLLVFVNVSGKWVGVIMNAPGATAAALGGNITENTVNNANITTTNNDAITNNINVAATSGDASVLNNNTGGNATSGNADTAVNLLNLDNAQFNVSSWFGVLFINVFGSWIGSLGAYAPPTSGNNSSTSTPAASSPENNTDIRVFRFVPQPTPASDNTAIESSLPAGAELASKAGQVLGTGLSNASQNVKTVAVGSSSKNTRGFKAVGGIMVGVGLSTIVIERFLTIRRSRSTTLERLHQ